MQQGKNARAILDLPQETHKISTAIYLLVFIAT